MLIAFCFSRVLHEASRGKEKFLFVFLLLLSTAPLSAWRNNHTACWCGCTHILEMSRASYNWITRHRSIEIPIPMYTITTEWPTNSRRYTNYIWSKNVGSLSVSVRSKWSSRGRETISRSWVSSRYCGLLHSACEIILLFPSCVPRLYLLGAAEARFANNFTCNLHCTPTFVMWWLKASSCSSPFTRVHWW